MVCISPYARHAPENQSFGGINARASIDASLGDEMGLVMGMTRRFIRTVSRKARITAAVFSALALVAVGLSAVPAVATTPGCGPEDNAIVCENSKPGTSWTEWDIQGAGDSSIQGFATDISVNVGQRIDFKIDTNAAKYTIDIYRTGWYQGLGARKITSVQPSATLPQIQPECLTDKSTELTDCGTWAVSASWNVPTDAVSGVYLAKLTRTDNDDSSHITFIVRNESSTSDILVQTSDPTWHAYNLYGGSDFYSGAANGRAYKISYNRPFATRAGIEARDFYFGAEYPLVRFLERNGYDVSYFSGVDTARHGNLLTNHNVFMSVGHDEYWSGAQRANVEAARDAGVNLQFLSGNEMYWRTRYEASSTGGNNYRTLVSYKETWSGAKIDPSPEWTGTWRDPRFASTENGAGLPENGVTGTAYVVNSVDYPVTVSAAEGKMRMWRDTGLSTMAAGSKTALAPHTVGYESNEDLPNGFRPPGLIHLSTTTGAVPEYLQDFGSTVAPGQTTHHTTMYKAASGARVFSAGSVQWTWGLDEWHDGDGAAADPRMQQAQVNLLADMDALPTTLMSTLTMPTAPKDTTAPTVAVTSAPSGTVKNGEKITVSGTASDSQGIIAAVEYSFDAGRTWKLAQGTSNWTFTAVQQGTGEAPLQVRAVDDSANYPTQGTAVPLTVTGPYSVFGKVDPKVADSGDGSAVELGLRFTALGDGYITGVRFYKATANTGTHTGTLWSLNGTQLATVTFSNESASGWQTASFANPVEVRAGTDYVVSYYAPRGHYSMAVQEFAYRGADANPLTAAGGFGSVAAGLYNSGAGFPTQDYDRSNYYVDAIFEASSAIGLTAYSQTPADTAHSVATSSKISAVFSKAVTDSSVSFKVTSQSGDQFAGTTAYNATTRTATFTPSAALARGTTYTVELTATDTSGNSISRGGSWSFRTMYPDPTDPNACPCGLYYDSEVPGIAAVNDGTPVTVGTRFSADVDGTVTGMEFYRSPGETGAHTGWLYSPSGQELAQVNFPDDSASGWQSADFSNPVAITANTEYVVAYRSNGTYPVTAGGLADTRSVGPLQTSANAGQYTYGDGYPAQKVSSSYLVDVRFQPAGAQLSITERTPQPGDSSVAVDSSISASFSQPLQSGATLQLSSSAGAVSGTSALSADAKTLTFTPAAALNAATVYTVTAKDTVGTETGAASFAPWSFRTAGDTPGLVSFLGDQQPAQLDPGDNAAVNLGMRLSTSKDITVHAIRYYQGPQGSGTHTGNLWASDGSKLGTATFPPAAGQGWQIAYLTEPVQLAAGSTFTVSYRAPSGGYVYTGGDFGSGRGDGTLSLSGNNGVFAYGAEAMPTSSWNASNYFADVMYTVEGGTASPSPSASTSPTPSPSPTATAAPLGIASRTPVDQASGVSTGTEISVTFSRAVDTGSTLQASTSAGPVAGTVQRSSDGTTLSLVPDAALPADTIVTVTPKDIVGTGTGPASFDPWKFRTAATPQDPADCPCGLFGNTELPTVASIADGTEVTLGARFSPSVDGKLVGLEFYRAMGETGTHTGKLYSMSGTVLGEVSFPDTGVSGWQHADFATPVAVRAGTEYVAAYRSHGTYAASPGLFGQPLAVGDLGTSSDAGVFSYADEFPSSTVSTSYLVDVRFVPNAPPVAFTDRSPAPGASDVAVTSKITATFNQPIQNGASLDVTAGGQDVAGSSALNAARTTLTFTPAQDLPAGSVITASAKDVAGADSGPVTLDPWTFLTAGQAAALSSFLGDAVPTQLDPADNAALEVGMRLQAAKDLSIHAVRYYRGPAGSGAAKGNIWSSSGALLGSVNFGSDPTPGWHTAYLAEPVPISQGTTFTVSYYAANGGYVFTPADFAAGRSNAELSLSGSNGVYAYGTSSMPGSSWNASNYFADLLYSVDGATAAKQAITSPGTAAAPATTQASEPTASSSPSPSPTPTAAPSSSTPSPSASTSPSPTTSSTSSPSPSPSSTPSGKDKKGLTNLLQDTPTARPPLELDSTVSSLLDPEGSGK